VHVRLNEEERLKSYLDNVGGSEFVARFLTMMEVKAANGSEEHLNDVVERVTGRPAQDFDSFVEEHKTEW
jgi:festuclavine dehydrogenase